MAEGETYSVEEMARLADRPASELLAELSVLELSGRLVRQAGGHFTRISFGRTSKKDTHGKGIGGRRIAGQGEDD